MLSDPAVAAEVTNPPQCKNCFIGELQLSPNPADPSGNTKLLAADLLYVDGNAQVWKAGAGDVTDGASIPGLFQPIIGGPWEKAYLPAAVMHDHYTNNAHMVRTWQSTARMFFSAMVVGNVEIIRAKLMYYAVYVFGPHWDKLAPGVPCGTNCIFSATSQMTFKPADYANAHGAELEQLKATIAAREISGDPLNLNDIENMARAKHPTHVFFVNDNTR
ncbi:DUF1353 domain-containing protein [Rhodopseudomonas sp. RCAM05734]|uniref:DUF1353 domain-containing protein n=1 Tax=Rhodopseudomonas sp. RCAM05734 TaxID=3457549 RepID=UPI004044C560